MGMLPEPIFQLDFELIPCSNNGMALSMISLHMTKGFMGSNPITTSFFVRESTILISL